MRNIVFVFMVVTVQMLYAAVETVAGQYCIVNISSGPGSSRYPVSYTNMVSCVRWSEDFKTNKVVLRRILPGSVKTEDGRLLSVDKPFFIGVFEVTQRQYELVMGVNPEDVIISFVGEQSGDCPMTNVSWDDARGTLPCADEGPGQQDFKCAPTSFVGRLSKKIGLSVDLPSELQWEYACLAGGDPVYGKGSNGWGIMSDYVNCYPWPGFCLHGATAVGALRPNRWGLYDMLGNVSEWCRDSFPSNAPPVPGGKLHEKLGCSNMRVLRGGSWMEKLENCRASSRRGMSQDCDFCREIGFRIVVVQ